MTQTATCVALQPLHETELAQHIESPSSAIAQTSDRFSSDLAEALLPVEEIAITSAELTQHREQQPDTTAPFKFDDAVLAGFRIGYRQDATETASKTLNASATATEKILEMAGWIQSMKSRLKRKEFGVFVKQLLGWVQNEARKYLDIARAFEGFDFSRLVNLEPLTLVQLCSKRYSPLIARLRDEANITQRRVQELISELLPKKARKQKPVAASSNAVLEKHPNTNDGSFYFTLKQANLSESIGSWLENKLESKTLGQVLSEAMEQQQSQEQLNALRQQIEAEAQQQARSRFEMLEFGLKQKIVHLEAQLATVKPSDIVPSPTATGCQLSTPLEATETPATATIAPENEPTKSIELATCLQTSSFDEQAIPPEKLDESLETQLVVPTSVQPIEYESARTSATDCSTLVASPSYLQLSDEASTTNCQAITSPWDTLKQLRNAESYIHKIDIQIKDFTDKLASPRLDRAVERELKGLLANRQKLRSTKISQVVSFADSSGSPANYQQLREQGRVVLATDYASILLLQAKTWADVVLVSGGDHAQLVNAVTDDWTLESKLNLVQILSSHLETEPNALSQIDWIPKELRTRALSTLSFKIRRIGGPDNLVDEPKLEYIPCSFVSLEYPGTKREQWVFKDSKNNNHPVFGRDEIEIEKF